MGKILMNIILLFCSISGIAQSSDQFITDKGEDVYGNLSGSQVNYLHKIYSMKIGTADELINGRDYIPYYFHSKFKPLLFANKNHPGSVTLNGRKYSNITLKYDTYTDEVIYFDTARTFNYRLYEVSLNKDNIDCFELYFDNDTLNFKYFEGKTAVNQNFQAGFYEVVYDGVSKYLIRHRSSVVERNGTDEYFYSPVGYISLGDGYSKITSLRQFARLFGERSDDVKEFINQRKINIRKADKNQILSVLKFYDSQITPAR